MVVKADSKKIAVVNKKERFYFLIHVCLKSLKYKICLLVRPGKVIKNKVHTVQKLFDIVSNLKVNLTLTLPRAENNIY